MPVSLSILLENESHGKDVQLGLKWERNVNNIKEIANTIQSAMVKVKNKFLGFLNPLWRINLNRLQFNSALHEKCNSF